MRVGFNARSLAATHMRGWTRYTVKLLRHLPSFGVELVLFSDQQLNPEHLAQLEPGSFRVILSPQMPYLAWEQGWLPLASARERVALLHAPANYGLPFLPTCPRLLTLHDAIDVAFEPSNAPQTLREQLVRASFWAARKGASRVITVSEHAKADLSKHWAIPEAKISVIYEASDLHERTVSLVEEQRLFDELGISGKFVLYAGGFERRKNVEFLVQAFRSAALSGVSLVLVGSKPPALLRVANAPSEVGAIYTTGFVSDATLTALYRRAEVFVYPSLYEGFGLQLCEAMSFGCPTLAAEATSLPEVLGTGGETFPLSNVNVLVSQLRRIAQSPSYRATLSDRATRRAKDFSWRQTAQATFEVYRETCR
jgi:glycosyltransferase involved in cell wall biosynthesis